jgi:hypothetical protein
MRVLSFCLVIVCGAESHAQKFGTETGAVSFKSDAELEMISASSTNLRGLIDPSTNQFAFSVAVRSFQGFNSELQREHFNEKYMESETFPRISFTGKIIEQVDFDIDGTYDVRAKGDLEVHGLKQTRIIKARITIENSILNVDAAFDVPLQDHNISIPRIVNQKIATEIAVVVKAALPPQ